MMFVESLRWPARRSEAANVACLFDLPARTVRCSQNLVIVILQHESVVPTTVENLLLLLSGLRVRRAASVSTRKSVHKICWSTLRRKGLCLTARKSSAGDDVGQGPSSNRYRGQRPHLQSSKLMPSRTAAVDDETRTTGKIEDIKRFHRHEERLPAGQLRDPVPENTARLTHLSVHRGRTGLGTDQEAN